MKRYFCPTLPRIRRSYSSFNAPYQLYVYGPDPLSSPVIGPLLFCHIDHDAIAKAGDRFDLRSESSVAFSRLDSRTRCRVGHCFWSSYPGEWSPGTDRDLDRMGDLNQEYYLAVLVARGNRTVCQSGALRAELLPIYGHSVVGWTLSDGCRIWLEARNGKGA
jgi:hypothetical protein